MQALNINDLQDPDPFARVAHAFATGVQLTPTCSAPQNVTYQVQQRTGILVASWDVTCRKPPTSAAADTLLEQVPGHLHILRVRGHDGRTELVLSSTQPDALLSSGHLSASDDRWRSDTPFMDMVKAGMFHVGFGPDHVAFLGGLALLCATLGLALSAVTGFTIGHAAALTLSTVGWVTVDSFATEMLIGWSVMLLGLDGLARVGVSQRTLIGLAVGMSATATAVAFFFNGPLMAAVGSGIASLGYLSLARASPTKNALRLIGTSAGFGLVHGLGVAQALTTVPWSRNDLLPVLLGFNVGAEVAQLLIMTAVLSVMFALRRWSIASMYVKLAIGCALCFVGAYWMTERAFG